MQRYYRPVISGVAGRVGVEGEGKKGNRMPCEDTHPRWVLESGIIAKGPPKRVRGIGQSVIAV
jgi:hypothetical protein